jgi:hypothetical protein
MRSLALFCGVASLAATSAANAEAAKLCGVAVSDIPAWIAQLSAPRADRLQAGPLYIAVDDRARSIVWTVTKVEHPAHPSVVCRRPTERNGRIYIDMQARCGGPKAACDRMMADFNALNAEMLKSLEAARKR